MTVQRIDERTANGKPRFRYQVQRSTFGGPWRIIADDLPDTAFTDDDVEPGVEYDYRVRAKNSHGIFGPFATVGPISPRHGYTRK
ncbi:MAG: fibronectin type III domain-containing protein [Acidimicrobiaceae bacterium]|nr:fibronectin type III domain-containing protein [Acidimicrobiaceae bacterium]MYH76374.1 fibronectin type III domain-containing protein [Acidimicrobiaceae bacterium]